MGEIESVIEFNILDILPTFALLLGRPWFHPMGGIPSTVHQKIKFPLNDKVVTIPAETNNIIACLNIVPPGFQISVIHEDWVDLKVAAIMKKMQYLPDTGLGGRYTGVTEFVDFLGQTSKHGLGYTPEEDTRTKKFTSFIPEGSTEAYQGQIEKWEKEGVEKPGFKIFKDIIDSKEKHLSLSETITEADIEELMRNLRLESDTENLNCDEVAAILESSIDDILFTQDDLCTLSLFENDDVMNSKVNEMKSDFAYLFDVFSDGSMHCIDPNTCIFDIHSICTEPFNIGTENEPRILHISKDITPEERKDIEKILIKYSKVFI